MSEQPEHEVVRDWFEPGLSIPDGTLVMVHYALVDDGTMYRREQRHIRWGTPYWTSWQRYILPEVPNDPIDAPPPFEPPENPL